MSTLIRGKSEDFCGGSAMRDIALDDARRNNGSSTGPQVATLSDRALELINGPRAEMYAAPEVNLARIASMWSAILGLDEPIQAWQVALMMCALKVARVAHQPNDDGLVDLVGYAELVARLR